MKAEKEINYFGRDLEAMSFATNYHTWIVEEFKPFLGHRVAEIGAGTGNFTSLLIKEEIEYLCSFEPSTNMYSILEERFKGKQKVEISNHFFNEAGHNYESCFDSVIYVNVLEHIKEDARELSYVRNSLKKGGYFLGFVPALSWLYSNLDKKVGHFRRYKKPDLIKLVEQAGFKIIKVKYFDLAGILPWFIYFVILKKSITGAKVSLYDKAVVPIMKKIEGLIPPPLGKNILIVAQKI
jgi:SAM-dependent methyltransferase